MRPEEHQAMFEAEDRHFWFVGTRRVLGDVLARNLGTRFATARLLDLGCGTGFTLATLPRTMRTVGVDYSPHALSLAARRGLESSFVRGSAYALPFADQSFDAVLALDVLEHLDDDLAAAREMWRLVAPGGIAVVTVPAFRFLWSEHDEALEHRRRYRLPEIAGVLTRAGFSIETASYYNSFLFPVVAAERLARKLVPAKKRAEDRRADLRVPSAPVNAMLTAILGSERHVLRHGRFPVGVSCLLVARRG